MVNQRKQTKRSHIYRLLISVLIILIVNFIAKYLYTRIDLTEDKRYTLTKTTKETLQSLDDILYVKVYLEGDFPSNFKRLRNETKEILREFRAYSSKIQFEFINPSESKDVKQRNLVYQELVRKGLNPTDVFIKNTEGSEQKIIFPGAILSYKNKEAPLILLQNQMAKSPEMVLNNSIQSLEYNLISAIKKITSSKKQDIAFIYGHNELGSTYVDDIKKSLGEFYTVHNVFLKEQINSLTNHKEVSDTSSHIKNKYKTIIIVQPLDKFSEKDKFIIDQFVMNGGSVLWLIDPVMASMDSLTHASQTMSMPLDLNLDDMLFTYGVKLNKNLVLDLKALPIPITTGSIGGQPQIKLLPWYYFPLLSSIDQHPIEKNLNLIATQFVSNISILDEQAPEIKKTVLLKTSGESRLMRSPSLIDLDILKIEPDQRLYNAAQQTIAVLLEGEFTSNFKGRMADEIMNSHLIGFKEVSVPAKMIVVSDGDMIRNQIVDGQALPLGYDRFTQQTFGNKDFIMNAVHYLSGNSSLIDMRTREVKIRLLDDTKVKTQKTFWQIVNVVLPLLFILLFGFILNFIRKRKFKYINK